MRAGRLFLYGTTALGVGAGTLGLSYSYARSKRSCIPVGTTYKYSPPASREHMMKRLKNEDFDLLVIGAGATGSGVVLDAATRGLNCAIVDMGDIASGASSRSSKLLHGYSLYLDTILGPKYNSASLPLIIENFEERSHAVKSLPFMSYIVPLVVPAYDYMEVIRAWVGTSAAQLLEVMTCFFDTGIPVARYLGKKETKRYLPSLNDANLKGSVVIHDGAHNDARRNLLLALSSSVDGYVDGQKGAAVANYVEVTGMVKDARGNIVGVKSLDRLSQDSFTISAKVVVNCSGAFTDVVRKMSQPNCETMLLAGGGVHLMLPKWYCSQGNGLMPPSKKILMLPWEDYVITGNTMTMHEPHEDPVATEWEVETVIANLASFLAVSPETIRNDMLGTMNGLRPMMAVQGAGGALSLDKLRHHCVQSDDSGLMTVMGGRWTNYRSMAEDVVNAALENHKDKIAAKRKCRTRNLMLIGSTDHTNTYEAKDAVHGSGRLPLELKKKYPEISQSQADHLARNYGFRALDVCKLGKEEGLLEPLAFDLPYLKAEVVYGIRYEMARLPSDILGRRTSLGFVHNEKALEALPEVIRLMQGELKWTPEQTEKAKADGARFLATTRTVNLPKESIK